MERRFFVRIAQLVAGVALASSAQAGLINFRIDSVDVATSGVTLGSSVTVSQSQQATDLLGQTFSLGAGDSKTFNLLDVTVSGIGAALLRRKSTASLAVVPCGTGNDIAGNPKPYTSSGLATVYAGEEAAE